MDTKLKDLIARAMELSREDRKYLVERLAENAAAYQVRDAGTPYSVSNDRLPRELIGMTSVTVVLPDDLAQQALAAGLFTGNSLEELIRRALEEQGTGNHRSERAARRRRRLICQDGHLVVEAFPEEQLITDTEVRGLLNKMEW